MCFCAVTHSTYLLNQMLVSLFTIHSLHVSQGIALGTLMLQLASHYNWSILKYSLDKASIWGVRMVIHNS